MFLFKYQLESRNFAFGEKRWGEFLLSALSCDQWIARFPLSHYILFFPSFSSLLSFLFYSRCVHDKIDFMTVVLVLANISDVIMQRHRARSSGTGGACRLLPRRRLPSLRHDRTTVNSGIRELTRDARGWRIRGGGGGKSLRYFRSTATVTADRISRT